MSTWRMIAAVLVAVSGVAIFFMLVGLFRMMGASAAPEEVVSAISMITVSGVFATAFGVAATACAAISMSE